VLQLRPAQAMAQMGDLLGGLAEIELCADTGVLLEIGARRGTWSRSSNAAQQAKLDSAKTLLARARAFVAAGDLSGADADVAQAAKLNEALNEEALAAEIRFTEGMVTLRRGEVAQSIDSLGRSSELAIASHHDELLADIWIFLARDVGARELRPAQIETWLGQAEAWVQRLNHNRDPRRFSVEAIRGNLQLASGNASDSVKTLTRAITTGESLWGKEDPRLISTLRDRALGYARLRQPKAAVADGERALELGIATWGAEHPDIARTRRALGLVYIEQLGDVERGKKEIEQALRLFSAYQGPDSIEVANCEQALSQAGLFQGDYARALEHAERAEQIFLRRLGPEHARRGEALVGVGVLRFMRKDYEGSLDAYQQALAILRVALGEAHASVAVLFSNIGETQLALGRADGARVEFEKALKILERSLGLEHADLALPLKGLGLAYLAGNRTGDALPVLERALALRLRSAAASDPQEVAETRWALARSLRSLGRTPARANELAAAALATYRTLGPDWVARVNEITRWLPRGFVPKPAPPATTP
jgi:eukaryotic-like serine/threonine-protein kinase